MPDGTAPPTGVIIERVCNGSTRPQAYADAHGEFSFQIGQTQDMLSDATDDSPSANRGAQGSQKSNATLFGCDLRAKLAGYRSDLISLAGRRNLDDPNIGTIFLHPYAKVEGLTTSATSALAPKDAHKAFDKGLEAVKKSKLDEAQSDFLKATDIYPRYAAAWLELGRIYEQHGQNIEAREAYTRSIAADSKFVNPYERMYLLSFREKKWEDVAQITARVIRLNSYDFPGSLYYNAVANSQLWRLDLAEKSAREAVAVSAAENPKVYYILGVILAKKQDFKGAVENLKIYLKSDAVTDRDTTAKLLADIEKRSEAKLELKPEP
jgi:tetratricopeptide (TPR) repeat protein